MNKIKENQKYKERVSLLRRLLSENLAYVSTESKQGLVKNRSRKKLLQRLLRVSRRKTR